MGNYVFTTDALVDAVPPTPATRRPSTTSGQHHPGAGEAQRRAGLRLRHQPGARRDRSRPRLLARRGDPRRLLRGAHGPDRRHPIFNLYNHDWPIHTRPDPLPPAKFVFDEEGRRGHAPDSMVCAGVVLSGGTARRSILSPGVHCTPTPMVEDSILMDGVEVGRERCRPPRDRRQERGDRRRARRSASTRRSTRSGSTCRPAGSW